MKKNIFLVIIVSVIIYFFFAAGGIVSISGKNASIDISSDAEINYLTALSVYRGEGWYKDFSNVYPPGRFILQAGLFRLIAPSIPTASLYFNSFTLFFSVTFFFLSQTIFSQLAKRRYLPYILSSIATLLYLCFIKSAQEVHTFSALFFIILLIRFKNTGLKQILLGLILAVVFLFRIDAGIMLIVACLAGGVISRDNIKTLIVGGGLIWLPVLLYIAIKGSLYNFLYDTVYYALWIQPKVIDLPIPEFPVGLLFYSLLVYLLASAISLSIYASGFASDKKNAIKAFALFSLLTFSAALGRSDEGHLWYGSVWIGIYVGYLLLYLLEPKKLFKEIKIIAMALPVMLSAVFILIEIKDPLFFTLVSVLTFLFIKKLPRQYAGLMLVSGVIAAALIFHSVAFVRLRFSAPQLNLGLLPKYNTFVSEGGEVAGLQFDDKTLTTLKDMKKRIGKNDRLFIYPDHALLYEYFKMKNPTRHDYQLEKTTEEVQQEITGDLESSQVRHFIIFPDSIHDNRPVWQWIKKNTVVDKVYTIEDNRVELRMRK